MKKRIYIIVSLIIIFIIIISGIVYFLYPKYNKDKSYSKEYVSSENNSIDFGNDSAYKIGSNKYGETIFKNPEKALKQLKKDYTEGIKAIQDEYSLFPISNWNFRKYGKYGWQLTETSDASVKEQAAKVTQFMDIYENSF